VIAAALAAATLAVVVQDNTALRASPASRAATHAQLGQGDLLEVRATRGEHLQVWDHRRERAGYVRATQVRALPAGEAQAAEALAVMRFLRDLPGSEPLGIAYVAAYLKAAPAGAITAEPFDALGTMAERLAQRAAARRGNAVAQLDGVAQYGVKFASFERAGAATLCYDGDAFVRVLAIPSADAEQKARAVIALTKPECSDPGLRPSAQAAAAYEHVELLDKVDSSASARLPVMLANRVHARRAGAWSAIAYQRARAGDSPTAAAQRAIDELAAIDRSDDEGESAEHREAALRVGAVRWAAQPALVPSLGRLALRTEPGEPGQTCVQLADAKTNAALARRCTYGLVWTASAQASRDGRALTLAVQTGPAWTELWVFRAHGKGWRIDALPPAAIDPSLGYAEAAGFVPGQPRLLVAREARDDEGRFTRRFEVLKLDTLTAERWASSPELLTAFRWQDARWKRESVAMR
jgi:hypothetical protein